MSAGGCLQRPESALEHRPNGRHETPGSRPARPGHPARPAEVAMGRDRGGERLDEPGDRERIEARLPPEPDDLERFRPAFDAWLDPAHESIAVQDRQDVVAPASLRGRDVDLPQIVEVEQAP